MESPSARWARLQELFEQAAAHPNDRRREYLDSMAISDVSMRQELEAMLAADSPAYALGIERLVNDVPAPLPPDPAIGAQFGAWRVLRPIGRGGMGTVYLAERADGQYEQRVALKVVDVSRSGHAAALFGAERRILARLSHPNIARLLDAGVTPQGTAFMAMELVDGEAITSYCDTRHLTIEQRLRLFLVVCNATQHAHQALIVHRDLKPSNIFVSRIGDVKLLDFGIAKLLEPDPGIPDLLTREHRAITIAYAAPEQLRGEPVTTATDVYALGIILYELLVGRRPFPGGDASPLAAERLIASSDPAAPSLAAQTPRLSKQIRGDLDRIVLKALRGEPERRYASAGQFAEDIDRFLAGRPIQAQPDSFGYRARRFVGRHMVAVGTAAAFGVLLVVLAVLMALQARRIGIERDRARVEQARAEQVVGLLVDFFQTANPEVVPRGDRLPIGEFLERAEGRALRELERQPELAARMRHVLGLVHHARSNDARARELLQGALDEQRRVSGPDSREALQIQVDLARVLTWIDARQPARALLDDAVERVERAHGEDDLLAASSFHALAGVLDDRAEVQQRLERAVRIARQRLSSTHRDRIRYTTSLAVEYLGAGRIAEARTLFDEARQGAEALNGGRTVHLIGVLNDSATLDTAAGDFAAAEAKHRRTLALATDLLGEDSFQTANALNNLAVALANQGRLAEAAEAFKKTYERHVVLFGEDHWRTANTMRNLGMAMLLVDDPRECERWMRRAVAATEGAERADRRAPYMRAQLARCLLRAGRAADGMALLEPAIAALDTLGPDATMYTANSRLWLARALLARGDLERAQQLATAAVDQYRRTRREEHPARAEAECDLAEILAARGRRAEARALLESCVPRVASYGQMEPWRKQSVSLLLARLRSAS